MEFNGDYNLSESNSSRRSLETSAHTKNHLFCQVNKERIQPMTNKKPKWPGVWSYQLFWLIFRKEIPANHPNDYIWFKCYEIKECLRRELLIEISDESCNWTGKMNIPKHRQIIFLKQTLSRIDNTEFSNRYDRVIASFLSWSGNITSWGILSPEMAYVMLSRNERKAVRIHRDLSYVSKRWLVYVKFKKMF